MIYRIIAFALALLLLPGSVSAQTNRRKRDLSTYKDKYRKDNNIPTTPATKPVAVQKDKQKPVAVQKEEQKPVAVQEIVEGGDTAAVADSLALDTLPPQPKYVTITEEVVIENPITREIAIALREKQVEVTDENQDLLRHEEEKEEEDDAPVQTESHATTTGGKFNPFKSGGANAGNKKTAFGSKKKTSVAGGGKSTAASGDKLRMAYTASNLSTSPSAPLYTFRQQPESPFAAELFEQNQAAPTLSLGGRWATTLHNASTLREMLVVNVDATTKQVKIIDGSDLERQHASNPQWQGTLTTHSADEQALNLKYEYNFQAPDIDNVGMFVARVLQPYCGKLVTTNPGQIKAFAAMEDTPVKVNCTVTFKLKPAKASLHGTMSVKCTAAVDDNSVQVVSLSIPCTMYRVSASYTGFDSSDIKPIDYVTADTSYAKTLLSKTAPNSDDLNNLGYCYLNGFGVPRDLEKAMAYFTEARQKGNKESYANLYLMYRNGWGCESKDLFTALSYLNEGRRADVPDALTLSADLMLQAPKSDATEAYTWLCTAERFKNDYAILRLGHLTRDGEGVAKNEDASVGYFNRSKHKDAYYEQARVEVKGKKWSAAYKLYMIGAKMGSTKCMQALAEMHLAGIGVRQDFNTAKRWFSKIVETNISELKGYQHEE